MRASLRAHGSYQCTPDDRLRGAIQTPSFRDGPQDQTSDVQLHIGESRDSGFDAAHRPGMTQSDSGLPATGWVVNLRREQLLTFGDTIAISTPPGTTSGLLPLDGICE